MADAPFWQDRPTLVTGATGLVGTWVVRRLLELEANVVCLLRDWVPESDLVQADLISKVNLVRGDLLDQAVLERVLGEYEVDTVIHLAAQTVVGVANRNPISTFESNIMGTWRLLEACRRSPLVKQIVLASSDKAYGEQETLPYTEATPLDGRHPYDVSKACADLIAQSYAATYGTPVAITRCGNFFGGGDLNWSRVVPGTIRSVLRGQRPVIRSDGKSVRDYFYVEDGAAAYLLLAERLHADATLKGHAFNFSYQMPVSVVDIVDRVLRMMGSRLIPEIRNDAPNEIAEQFLDAQKAREVLKWRPAFTLDQGLRRTIDWYKTAFEAEAAA
ncbi:MAG: GDP-mannose 4,6-dehydratase [Candidatus Dormibacteraeota bacterium]|nr:GDP-mannose 4,6-dehydratase [Candidatus Dormibacteraeota bacterium]